MCVTLLFVTSQFRFRSFPNKSSNFNQFIKDYDETIRIPSTRGSLYSVDLVFSSPSPSSDVFPSARKGGGDPWIDSIFI